MTKLYSFVHIPIKALERSVNIFKTCVQFCFFSFSFSPTNFIILLVGVGPVADHHFFFLFFFFKIIIRGYCSLGNRFPYLFRNNRMRIAKMLSILLIVHLRSRSLPWDKQCQSNTIFSIKVHTHLPLVLSSRSIIMCTLTISIIHLHICFGFREHIHKFSISFDIVLNHQN